MKSYKLRKPFQWAYVIIGLIFLGVASYLWLYDAQKVQMRPERATMYLITDIAVTILGFLIVLRPWRCKLVISETALLYYDGIMPRRRYIWDEIIAVYSKRQRRMILFLHNGQQVFLDYNFSDIDGFLLDIKAHNIRILDTIPKQQRMKGRHQS